jgi:hypothetical protein
MNIEYLRQTVCTLIRDDLDNHSDAVDLHRVSWGNKSLHIVIEPKVVDVPTVETAIGEAAGNYIGALNGQYALFERAVIDIVDSEDIGTRHRIIMPTELVAARDGGASSQEIIDELRDTYHIVGPDGEVHSTEEEMEDYLAN